DRFATIALPDEHLHQPAVARLAIRLEADGAPRLVQRQTDFAVPEERLHPAIATAHEQAVQLVPPAPDPGCVFANEVWAPGERQPALTARKIAFPKELLAPFGRHFAREIDPQHGIAKHSPNASSDDLRHPGRSFEEVRNAKARRVRVRLGPADR